MRDVPAIWDAWTSGLYLGDTKPSTRVTIEKSYYLRVTDPVLGQWTRGPARWWQRKHPQPDIPSARNTAQVESEIPNENVLRVEINRSIDQDAADCTITIGNMKMPEPGETPEADGQFGRPGYFTWSRGETVEARSRWGQAPNEWSKAIDTNALVRVYTGFGGEEKTIAEAVEDGNLVLYGVFLIDMPTADAGGTLTLKCRDMMKLLLEQELSPPLVPRSLYPVLYQRYTYQNYMVGRNEIGPGYEEEITVRAQYGVDGDVGPFSSSDREAGDFNSALFGGAPGDALDWSFNDPPNAGAGEIGHQRTWWLSEPHEAANEFAWIEFNAFGSAVNRIYLHPRGGNFKVYVSVMENGEWVTPESSEAGVVPSANPDEFIPYVVSVGTMWESAPPGSVDPRYFLPRTYAAERIRLTFTNLVKMQEGGFRAGVIKFVPLYDKSAAEYPVRVLASAAVPYNVENSTGYWQARSDGLVHAFGDARDQNPNSTVKRHEFPVVGMCAHPDGLGYWTVDYQGRVVSYGSAAHYGDLSANGTFDAVDIACSPSGSGYWLLQKDGTVTEYGDAVDHGSATVSGTMPSGSPKRARSIESHPDDMGYWVLITDGEVQEFNLTNHGSADRVGFAVTEYVGSIRRTHDGEGYWITSGSGKVQAFGDAQALGDSPAWPAEKWAEALCWDLIPSSLGDNGYAVQHANGVLDVFGTFEYFGSMGEGNGRLRYDGNYKDWADIVRDIVLWSGFYLYQYPALPARPEVYGNIETTGSFTKEDLTSEQFDKKHPIEPITDLKQAVGYIVYCDAEGGFRFQSPNWWAPGNFDYDGNPLDLVPELHEEVILTGYSVSKSDQQARSEIYIASSDPDVDSKSIVVARTTPRTAPDLRGMVKPAGWVNGTFTNYKQQKVMVDLIDLHTWFARRQGNVAIVANPLIDPDDQVKIVERVTGETSTHYVRGVQFVHDLNSGAYEMNLTTHWLGGAPLGLTPLFLACAARPDGLGYWQLATNGDVYQFGTAQLYDPNEEDIHTELAVGIRSTASGDGYWTLGCDGKVISYGDAEHFGDLRRSELDVRDFAITPSGLGYWILLANGGVFEFGDAEVFASPVFGGTMPNTGAPVIAVAIESHPVDQGWWVLLSDGRVEAAGLSDFGNADSGDLVGTEYFGTIRRTQTGDGYYIPSGGAKVQAFGDATDFGDGRTYPLDQWVFSLCWDMMPCLFAGDEGYALQRADGTLEMFGDFGYEGAVGSNSGYVARQRTWAISTKASADRSPFRQEIAVVSDNVIAALRKSGSTSAQQGISTGFGDPVEPTLVARVSA